MKHPIWLDEGWQPTKICLCLSKKAWKRFLKEYKLEDAFVWNSVTAMMHSYESAGDECVIAVTLHDDFGKENSIIECFGVLAHEATHVFQEVASFMGEENPSPEFEAYAVQNITQQLATIWWHERGKELDRPVSSIKE